MTRCRGRRRFVLHAAAFVLVLAVPVLARAHFEQLLTSARSAALGGAFAAVADDPSAVIDNPGGLCGIRTFSLLSTYRQPWGVTGIDEGVVAAVVPAGAVTLGASWFHRGVRDAMSEDMLVLAVARDLKRTAEDASLSVGASLELARVSVRDGFDTSESVVSAGAGALLRPFAFIGMGYSIRHATSPAFDLVDGGADTPLSSVQAAGLSYYWQQRLVVTVEGRQDASGTWRARGGFELQVERHLVLRGGLAGADATAGLGITWSGFTLDAALMTHEFLGPSYLFTLRWARAAEVEPF